MTNYEKKRIALRYYLYGKSYFRAADALEYAQKIHSGFRKDGVTPEFQHQTEIVHYLRTLLPWFSFPEETIIAAILHDTKEDYGVLLSVIEDKYGKSVAIAVDMLDKNGKDPTLYFDNIANNPIASLVKPADRIHNIQTMPGVFTAEKQLRYIKEVEDFFLPMIKKAKRLYPSQEAAYENMKHMLNSQIELIEHGLGKVNSDNLNSEIP